MAVSAESAIKVRQKAYNAVYSPLGSSTSAISPYHFYALKALFLHLSLNKGNPDLAFKPYSTADCTTNNGTDLTGAACTLYAWYGSAARTSGTTASFGAIHDAADNSATTTTVWTAKINATGQSFLFVEPNGRALATGCTISHATAVGGATESSATDATNGFVIVGS